MNRNLVVGCVCLAIAAASPSPGRDLPEILESGTLRVLAVDGSEAFFALNPAEEPGLDRAILESFARLHGLELVAVEVPSWGELIPALVEGRGDIAAGGVTVTAGRQEVVSFSAEVFPTRLIVVTRQPHRVVESLEQLREEKVGTIKGTSLAEALAEAGVASGSIDDSVPPGGLPDALRSGQVSAVVLGIEDALVLRRDDPEAQLGMYLGAAGSLAFGVQREAPGLLAALDEFLGNLRRTPTWNRLVLETFGEAALPILRRARRD